MPTIEEQLEEAGAVWRKHVDSVARQSNSLRSSKPSRNKRRIIAAAAAAIVAVPIAGVAIRNAAQHQPGGQQGVASSCAGPELRIAHDGRAASEVVTPGSEITVAGRYYLDRCNDTNRQLGPTPEPTLVKLSLRHGSHVAQLGSVQAHGELGTFRVTIRIPAGFPLGRATLVSDPPTGPNLIRLDIREQ